MVETERLLLRPWREDDEVELVRLMSDPAVGGGRDLPHERIVAFSRDSLRQWRVNGFGPWATLDKATGRWIGRVGLDELGDRPGSTRSRLASSCTLEWWGAARHRDSLPLCGSALRNTGSTGSSRHGCQSRRDRRVMKRRVTYRGSRY